MLALRVPQQRVQSLDRALDLLEALAGTDELGVSEIAAQTGLVPSTAHRLLGTLVARGYAAQSPTAAATCSATSCSSSRAGCRTGCAGCKTAARPHLEAIQDETGETTNLVVLEGRNVVYVDSVSGTRSVRLFTEIGHAIPAHTSGAGKALLAWRDPADVEALLGGAPLQRLHPAHADDARGAAGGLRADPPARLQHRQRGARAGRRAASRRRCSTTRGCRWRRSACPARRRASCTPTRPTLAGLLREHAEQVRGSAEALLGRRGRRR